MSRQRNPDDVDYRPKTLPFKPETKLPREPRRAGQAAQKKAATRPIYDRWHLVDAQGRYLHYSGNPEFVKDVNYAWWGITAQVAAFKKKNPELADLREVPWHGV